MSQPVLKRCADLPDPFCQRRAEIARAGMQGCVELASRLRQDLIDVLKPRADCIDDRATAFAQFGRRQSETFDDIFFETFDPAIQRLRDFVGVFTEDVINSLRARLQHVREFAAAGGEVLFKLL